MPGIAPHQQGTSQFIGFSKSSATAKSNALPVSVGKGDNICVVTVGAGSVAEGFIGGAKFVVGVISTLSTAVAKDTVGAFSGSDDG